MLAAALVIGFVLLLLLVWAFAPRGVPWANNLTRLRAGAAGEAEWMAPPEVVRAVKRDYLATQAWLADCSADWGLLGRELERHAAGEHLQRQRAVLAALVQTRGPRLAAVLTADRQLAVRHFSDDGLHCYLLELQSNRTMVTRPYWAGRAEVRQRLPDMGYVLQMGYDRHDRRWKVERVVQALPAGRHGQVQVRLAVELPVAAGRDN